MRRIVQSNIAADAVSCRDATDEQDAAMPVEFDFLCLGCASYFMSPAPVAFPRYCSLECRARNRTHDLLELAEEEVSDASEE
jgi:hypothetical protein